ncbi:MAG: hypothetical protein RL380_1552 [Verrucomicrobiota bacterium]
MTLLRSILLAATTLAAPGVVRADSLPWQAQFNPRTDNLPPAARAQPLFGRSTFIFAPRAPLAETNVATPANPETFVIAPIAAKTPVAVARLAKPTFTEYRLEIFGRPTDHGLPTTDDGRRITDSAPRTTHHAPRTTDSAAPTFSDVPPANPDFAFHPRTAAPATTPLSAPPTVDPETPKPLAVEPDPAVTKPKKNSGKAKPALAAPDQPHLIVNADNALGGKVVMADPDGRYVILNFPLGQMPRVDSTMTLYRHGVKSATLKITGPQRDDHIAADVLTGHPAEGDAARED